MTSEPTTFTEGCDLIADAVYPVDLFGGRANEMHFYRQLVKLVHPDMVYADYQGQATAVFTKLQNLWDRWRAGETEAGGIVESKTATYESVRWASRDSLCDYFTATTSGKPVVLKRVSSSKNNDLLYNEWDTLSHLDAALTERERPYFPRILESFRLLENKEQLRVHVFEPQRGLVSLAQLRLVFPDGLDPKDVAWIWRRLLYTVGVAQDNGFIHGAILPEHVLVDVVHHGLVLHNWCFSVPVGSPIKAIVPSYRDWYDESVLQKKNTERGSDIHLLTKTMEWLMDYRRDMVPFNNFVRGCLSSNAQEMHAHDVLRDFDGLLETLYGPRKFHPFPAIGTVPNWPY